MQTMTRDRITTLVLWLMAVAGVVTLIVMGRLERDEKLRQPRTIPAWVIVEQERAALCRSEGGLWIETAGGEYRCITHEDLP